MAGGLREYQVAKNCELEVSLLHGISSETLGFFCVFMPFEWDKLCYQGKSAVAPNRFSYFFPPHYTAIEEISLM